MKRVAAVITYITMKDIRKHTSFDNVSYYDVKDIDLLRNSEVLILKHQGKYKVLKSRY